MNPGDRKSFGCGGDVVKYVEYGFNKKVYFRTNVDPKNKSVFTIKGDRMIWQDGKNLFG